MIEIDVIDGVPGSSYTRGLSSYVPAFQEFDNLVAQAWQLEPATLRFVKNIREADPSHWWIVWNNHSDVSGAGGYHDNQPNGLPISKVFAGDAHRYGFSPTVDSTHEQAEMRVDPYPDTKPRLWDNGAGVQYLVEVGDPVEGDLFGFEIDKVLCTDFVLPDYFSHAQAGQFDHTGHLKAPCNAMLDGGYLSYVTNGQWRQQFAYLPGGQQSYRSRRHGRGARAARI